MVLTGHCNLLPWETHSHCHVNFDSKLESTTNHEAITGKIPMYHSNTDAIGHHRKGKDTT